MKRQSARGEAESQQAKKQREDQVQRLHRLKQLFDESEDRFVLFPIVSQPIWDMYKRAERSFWTAEEIDLQADLVQFQSKLTDNERHYIKHVLGFFASSDGIVNENLLLNLASKVTLPEARCFYMFQMTIENIHAEMYSLLIDTLIPEADERQHLFNAIHTVPCIEKKARWALAYMSNRADLATVLVAFAAVEGIFFSASFCAIFWLKKRGLMPGLCSANELIRRDEGMHTDFACLIAKDMIYRNEDERLTAGVPQIKESKVYNIIREAVQYEQKFVRDSLPVS